MNTVCTSVEGQESPFKLDKQESNTKLNQMQGKMMRSTAQILSSIKKRRVNSDGRVSGFELNDLADQIIEQCKVAILSANTVVTNEEEQSNEDLDDTFDEHQVKCITLTKTRD